MNTHMNEASDIDLGDDLTLLTLDDVARALQMSRRSVTNLISPKCSEERRLKSIPIGTCRRVRRSVLIEYLRRLEEESA